VLISVAMAVLIFLFFLMASPSGGPFARKLLLRSYFEDAVGLKEGAPVALDGVVIGSVARIRVVQDRNPTPVEVTMRVGREYLYGLHGDSTASITQAGVLGDSFVDISSVHASGPAPANDAELKTTGGPSIQDVISTSEVSIEDLNTLTHKVETLVDTLNSRRGTAGELINSPELFNKLSLVADDLENITSKVAWGKGTLGKLVTDDTLYIRADSAVDRLDKITAALDEGKGSAGQFLRDDSLYNNLNAFASNANQLVAGINDGKGTLGMIAEDPAFAGKLDDMIAQLDSILKNVDEGKGTLGQLVVNRALYDHADRAFYQAQGLVKSVREDPKKYLVIRMKIF
jgi:phospholipid/cholesterol/gamma-HCH transport system substrate-binding protein